ncbi:Small basic protein [Desulfonispora thiosulfatigenes DSM 11270]|uniref:Small basic protein n=1 Tax=Desulfonispora thiosulfatigenes DSM 11270 TaxID=656914 RepID=A0A1W1V920_DESTI|nr:small basic family protein [Desulfonispora thiosulfatigenes]SMB89551.1 Small basic protein [Desulfonispora thiosulfatigenes DSM 11270]
MWLPLLGLLIGLLMGSVVSVQIPLIYAKYMSIAILASLDSVFGGIKGLLGDTFDGAILITGFISNTILAGFLAYIGDRLGIDLYLAAVFAFGVRLFQNLATIRHHLLYRTFSKTKKVQ